MKKHLLINNTSRPSIIHSLSLLMAEKQISIFDYLITKSGGRICTKKIIFLLRLIVIFLLKKEISILFCDLLNWENIMK